MLTLARDVRKTLEATVKKARKAAEAGARKVIDERLRVGDAKPPGGLSAGEQALRRHLRAHGRQLGDRRDARGAQTTDRLVAECAYEHWHRMLFARFLAETELLIEPESQLPISLADCQELARERGEDWLVMASAFAVRMLPKIFRPDDPVLAVDLPPETRSALEDFLKSLPSEVFTADDSLGWVYQFWQADEKERVNASGGKIGAEELPAVTQLFTEDYMVLFLLHNTLGAWWAGKVLASGHVEQASPLAPLDSGERTAHKRDACATSAVGQASPLGPAADAAAGAAHNRDGCATSEDELRAACRVGDIEWTYLRFVKEDDGRWRPAAGAFEGWPKTAREITVLDPCMGSGHFLVFALPILVALRMAEDGLSRQAAVDAVLRDNLHGLEIDPRCTQIAAFNLALAAWKLVAQASRLCPSPVAQASRLCPEEQPASASSPSADQARTLDLRLPELQLACSGLTPAASEEEWVALAEQSGLKLTAVSREPILNGLRNLHALFSEAPTLGSLIDPSQLPEDMFAADYETLKPYLASALSAEREDDEIHERAVAAAGMVKAAELLAGEYTLVITNVPYLGRGKLHERLKAHLEQFYLDGKADLATAFILRCAGFSGKDSCVALVTPQSWLFLTTYKRLRTAILERQSWNIVARLGPRAFETIGGHVVNVALQVITTTMPHDDTRMSVIDVSEGGDPVEKADVLRGSHGRSMLTLQQSKQLRNPDAVVKMEAIGDQTVLGEYANCYAGILNGDSPKFRRLFWEFASRGKEWVFQQSTVDVTIPYAGREGVIFYDEENGHLREDPTIRRERLHDSDQRGNHAWRKWGVGVSQMNQLPVTLYSGEKFDSSIAVILPADQAIVPALWVFCTSNDFGTEVRRVNQKMSVENGYLAKIPFDLAYWKNIAAEQYPDGLPEPESDDPTQWLFHGRPDAATAPLQVAVARLLGYRWPAELDVEQASSLASSEAVGNGPHNRDGCATSTVEQASPLAPLDAVNDGAHKRDARATGMRLSKRARELAGRSAELLKFADGDGIVCLTPIKGEASAADRLNRLLAAAYGAEWSAGKLDALLRDAGYAGKTLDVWLRDGFFENHCAVFHNRPFIWHIWDGQQKGFHALVNYHRLAGAVEQASPLVQEHKRDAYATREHKRDAYATREHNRDGCASARRTLEKLIYTYLGDWIDEQRRQQQSGADGAEARLAAAIHLQGKLENILHGDPPYDIFVRWKPLAEQPIGWEPDINDGVRINIRPFMTARPLGARAKNACILRVTPKSIKWEADRGKEPHREKEDFPWFWSWDQKTDDFTGGDAFDGKRWNGLHYSVEMKQAARDRAAQKETTTTGSERES